MIFLPSINRSNGHGSALTVDLDMAITTGVPFTLLAQLLPFILIGIGVDDMVSLPPSLYKIIYTVID